MAKNIYDLDPERLSSTDENGNRIYIYPEDVKGKWKDRRRIFYWFLIVLFLGTPWIYTNGKSFMLLNIFKREFTFFGSTFYGVEPILMFLALASGIFFIAFMTSLFGRVWCGWACPQTVFIQAIFAKIEIFFEGKARARRELDKAPWDFNKFWRRSGKWITFLVISMHLAHTFVSYFVGAHELNEMIFQDPHNNWEVFVATLIIAGVFLLDFGWFREQFCIIACPYGRMQSVAMDENSLVVAYDPKRGEPRRGTEGVARDQEGDCINCYNCVKVCPTGIDIRRGTQLECIACTQCIDACDDIMTKLKRPTGLIKYTSELELQGKERKTITIRSGIYVAISALLISFFIFFHGHVQNISMVFLRSKVPFTTQVLENNEIRVSNQFILKVSHQGEKTFDVYFTVKEVDLKSEIEIVTPMHPTVIDKPLEKVMIFFRFNKKILEKGTRRITVEAYNRATQEVYATKEVVLVGPVD